MDGKGSPLFPQMKKKRGRTDARQAITDRLSICRQTAAPPAKLSDRLFVWAGGWLAFVSLCLRVCDEEGGGSALSAVPLCLCASVVLLELPSASVPEVACSGDDDLFGVEVGMDSGHHLVAFDGKKFLREAVETPDRLIGCEGRH